MTPEENAEKFLKLAHLYQLGDLQTESVHPKTKSLSVWAQNDLKKAISALVEVDKMALEKFKQYLPKIRELRNAIQETLDKNNKVYFCGCGATGRLSLTIESLWREAHPDNEQVQAFMAGGDVALVHSIEGFEDYPEYGARQLKELGFKDGDLLIGPTEGGETPYVIGAIEEAAKLGANAPWMLYCNPDEILCDKVERSRKVIENPKIKKLNLSVGPMALSGSTRMQASTVLQLACGLALFRIHEDKWSGLVDQLIQQIHDHAVNFLEDFIKKESEIYKNEEHILYETKNSMITVFTDTTERAPTFSLMPFRHHLSQALQNQPPSLSYVIHAPSQTKSEAWRALLGRDPRALDWQGTDDRVGTEYLLAFNFCEGGRLFREQLISPKQQHSFHIYYEGNQLHWQLEKLDKSIEVPSEWHALFKQTFLKQLLNMHSTLVMGRLDRYKNNVMTWVYPTNGKLVDRTARYINELLQEQGIEVSYEVIIKEIFKQLNENKVGKSVVLYCVESLKKQFK